MPNIRVTHPEATISTPIRDVEARDFFRRVYAGWTFGIAGRVHHHNFVFTPHACLPGDAERLSMMLGEPPDYIARVIAGTCQVRRPVQKDNIIIPLPLP